jgi:hypothetical protein
VHATIRYRIHPAQTTHGNIDESDRIGFDHVRRSASGMSRALDDLHRHKRRNPDLHAPPRSTRNKQIGDAPYDEPQCVPYRINPQIKTVDNPVHRPGDQKVVQPHPTGRGHDRPVRIGGTVEFGHGGGDTGTQP